MRAQRRRRRHAARPACRLRPPPIVSIFFLAHFIYALYALQDTANMRVFAARYVYSRPLRMFICSSVIFAAIRHHCHAIEIYYAARALSIEAYAATLLLLLTPRCLRFTRQDDDICCR